MKISKHKKFFEIILVLIVALAYGQQSQAQTQEDESIKAIKEQIERRQQIKQKKLKDEPRINKVKESLLELEDIYKKEGKEAAKKYAQKRRFILKDDHMVKVNILLSIPSESFNSSLFESLGGEINAIFRGRINVFIPIDRIRDVIDNIDGIEYIYSPGRPVPMSESEGVLRTGASAYHSSPIGITFRLDTHSHCTLRITVNDIYSANFDSVQDSLKGILVIPPPNIPSIL